MADKSEIPEVRGDIFKCLALPHKQSQTQRSSVYNLMRWMKILAIKSLNLKVQINYLSIDQ